MKSLSERRKKRFEKEGADVSLEVAVAHFVAKNKRNKLAGVSSRRFGGKGRHGIGHEGADLR